MKRDEELLKQLDRETFDEEWYKKYPKVSDNELSWAERFYRGLQIGIIVGMTLLLLALLFYRVLSQ